MGKLLILASRPPFLACSAHLAIPDSWRAQYEAALAPGTRDHPAYAAAPCQLASPAGQIRLPPELGRPQRCLVSSQTLHLPLCSIVSRRSSRTCRLVWLPQALRARCWLTTRAPPSS